MTQDQLVGKTVDYIFDVEVEDGTVTQVAYLGVVTKIVEKKKSKRNIVWNCLTLSTIMMKTSMMIASQMKKIPLNLHFFESH